MPRVRFAPAGVCALFLCCLVPVQFQVQAQAAREDAASLRREGGRLFDRGDLEGAIVRWRRAAELWADQPVKRAEVLLELVSAHQLVGDNRLAAGLLAEVQEMELPVRLVAATRNLQGTLALSRRDHEVAWEHLGLALTLAEEAKDEALRVMILNNQGNALAAQARFGEAGLLYEESAAGAGRLGSPMLTAQARVNALKAAVLAKDWLRGKRLAAEAESSLGSLEASSELASLWMSIGRSCGRWEEPETRAEQLQRARQCLLTALGICEPAGDERGAAYALGYLGELYLLDGQPAAAAGLFERAIGPSQRLSLPHALYRWKWGMGRAEVAMEHWEAAMGHYRAAVETLLPVRHDLVKGAPDWSGNEPVSGLFGELSGLLLRAASTEPGEARVQSLLREVRDTRELFKSSQFEDYYQDECVSIALSGARSVDAVAEGTGVVYVVPLPDRTELLLSLGEGGMRRFRVEVGEEELTRVAGRFRELLEKRVTYECLGPARALYGWLIAPMLGSLRAAGVETIVFVPDGVLSTIPMGALYDGRRYMLEEFAVAVTPGLTLLGPAPLGARSHQVLLAGVSEPVQGFPALDNVASEVSRLKSILGGTVLMNRDFRSQRLEEVFARNAFSIVHVASHGRFDGDVNGTFVLTHDGRLTLNQLERLIRPSQFRGQPVELLTLSACETAAGDERAALGLAGVALKAGARSALATLWSVNDEATSILIADFYGRLSDPLGKETKATALRQAQIGLLTDPRYDHPAFWAPFLMIGNWL